MGDGGATGDGPDGEDSDGGTDTETDGTADQGGDGTGDTGTDSGTAGRADTDTGTDTGAAETRAQIMEATYRALSEHGYAETTVGRIAEAFDRSKPLIYQHYDGKDDLLEAFLARMLGQFERELESGLPEAPRPRLEAIVETVLPEPGRPAQFRFRRAILEMRARAPHRERFHEQFVRTDRLILDELAATVRRGVAAGAFRDVDPEATAEYLFTLVYGALERGVTLDDQAVVERTRDQIDAYLNRQVYRTEGGDAADAGAGTDADDTPPDGPD